MAEFVLKNNFFEFNGGVKRQKSKWGITTFPLAPLYWRYIFRWTHGEEKLTQFLNEFNNFHSYLKFTYETSSGTVNFLDLNVSLRNGVIHTDLYIKPTDCHHYLHYQYPHPLHIKTSITFSQALRVNRICSSEKDFKTHVSHTEEWLLARGYSEIVVNNQIDKVVFGRYQSVKKILESGIPLLLPITLRLKKSLENWLGTYFLFYTVMEKYRRFSHPLRSYREKNKRLYSEI